MLATEQVVQMPAMHGRQIEIFEHPARFKVAACGAQWGKSILAAGSAIDCATQGGHVWWIFPDYPLASIGWDYLRGLCVQIPTCKIEPGEHIVRFPGNGFVQIKSTNQTLRGRPLDLVIFDEAAFCPESSWEEEVAPRLSTRLGKALFISTPDGHNWFHRIWEMGHDPEFPDWQSWQIPTWDNPHIPRSEEIKARERLSDIAYRQEYLAEFVVRSGAVFPTFRRDRHVRQIEIGHALPIHIGVDFGFRTFAAVLFQMTSQGEIHIVGELQATECTTEEAVRRLVGLPFGNGKPFGACVGTVGCDPAGDARNLHTGRSDVSIVRSLLPAARVGFSTWQEHRSPEWRAGQVRNLLMSAAGTVRLFVDPSCKGVIRMFENSVYPEHKEGQPEKNEPVKDGVHDHIRDALGYGLVNAGAFGQVGARAMQVSGL